MFVGGAIEHQGSRAGHTGTLPEWAEAIPSFLGMADAHDLGGCSSPGDLRSWLERFAGDFGFTGARYAHLGHQIQLRGQPERPPLRFLSSLGEDLDPWRAGDPSAPRAFRSFLPFAWTTADNMELPDRQRSWQSVERLRGVMAGIAIPVQDYMAGPAYVSLFGRSEGEVASILQIESHQLLFLAISLHLKAKAVLPPSGRAASPLTDRELTCLRHAASGADVLQTAADLGISKRSIETYFSNAARKLGASNKIHAVAIALSSGLIQI